MISFCILSAIPGNIVLPPESAMLQSKSFLVSISHFMIDLKQVSWIPADSTFSKRDGWKRASGHRNSVFINPRPEGYGSRFVVLSIYLSIYLSVNRATESSAHFFAPVKVRTG